jgi:hypothetical protein
MVGIDQLDCIILSLFFFFFFYLVWCVVWYDNQIENINFYLFLFRLNYASILFVLILSSFIETSNAQRRVCITFIFTWTFVMQSFRRTTSDNKQATTVNKQFRHIFYLHESAKRRLCIHVRVNWTVMVVIEWLASSLSILIILSFSITDGNRTTGEQMPQSDEQKRGRECICVCVCVWYNKQFTGKLKETE